MKPRCPRCGEQTEDGRWWGQTYWCACGAVIGFDGDSVVVRDVWESDEEMAALDGEEA